MAFFSNSSNLLRKIFKKDTAIPPEARPALDPSQFPSEKDQHMTTYEWMLMETQVAADRLDKYDEYRKMDDEDGDLPDSVLDSYRDDACQRDLYTKRIVWPESENDEVTKLIDKLFKGPLNTETEFKKVIREMMKMGDCFEQLVLEPRRGVLAWTHRPPDLIDRHEDEIGRLRGFSFGQTTGDQKAGNISLPWDYCHFRLGAKHRGALYGTSLLEPARRRWRELRMAEQAALLFRIKMHPDRDVYYIDCGTQSVDHQMRTVWQWRNQMKKKRFVDPRLLKYEVEYDPHNTEDDIFWPLTANKNSRVERLSGGGKMADMEDLDYWLKRFLTSVKIPPGYFGYLEGGGGLNLNTSLAQQDIRYARQVQGIQQDALEGLARICFIHLALLGIDPFLPKNKFELVMTPVSFLDEFHRQELFNLRLDIASRLMDLGERAQFKQKPWFDFVVREFCRFPPEILREVEGGGEEEAAPEGEEAGAEGGGEWGEGLTKKDRARLKALVESDPGILDRLSRLRVARFLGGCRVKSEDFSLQYTRESIDKFDKILAECQRPGDPIKRNRW